MFAIAVVALLGFFALCMGVDFHAGDINPWDARESPVPPGSPRTET